MTASHGMTDLTWKSVEEAFCPICHAIVGATDGIDPIRIKCHRCGERSYERAFCSWMAEHKLSTEEAACVAGYMRKHPDFTPSFHDVKRFARDLVSKTSRHQKTADFLNHLADAHGLRAFWLPMQREGIADLLGAASLVDRDDLMTMLEACVSSGLLERPQGLSIQVNIPQHVWTEFLKRPLPSTA